MAQTLILMVMEPCIRSGRPMSHDFVLDCRCRSANWDCHSRTYEITWKSMEQEESRRTSRVEDPDGFKAQVTERVGWN